MYCSITFANEFIIRSQPEGLEHLKIQKLVYFVYGWWLSQADEPLMDEPPVADEFGPVFKGIYKMLKVYGREPIKDLLSEDGEIPRLDEEDAAARELVDWVWNRYGQTPTETLATICHRPGTPWYQYAMRSEGENVIGTAIPIGRIKEFYEDLSDFYFSVYPNHKFGKLAGTADSQATQSL